MSDQITIDLIESAELIIAVDDTRTAEDPFKLSTALRTLVEERLATLKSGTASVSLTEGGRRQASGDLRTALDGLETLLHDGYRFIAGIPSFEITAAERLEVFIAYGWAKGELGEFPAATYLTELYPDLREHPRYRQLRWGVDLIGRLTRGSYPLHYRNHDEIVAGFRRCGFAQVQVLDPSADAVSLGLPPARLPGLVRVIQART